MNLCHFCTTHSPFAPPSSKYAWPLRKFYVRKFFDQSVKKFDQSVKKNPPKKPKIVDFGRFCPKSSPVFRSYNRQLYFYPGTSIYFWNQGGLGNLAPHVNFWFLVTVKSRIFVVGPQTWASNRSRGLGITMFRSGQGVEWYQVCWDSIPISEVILKKTPSLNLFQTDFRV